MCVYVCVWWPDNLCALWSAVHTLVSTLILNPNTAALLPPFISPPHAVAQAWSPSIHPAIKKITPPPCFLLFSGLLQAKWIRLFLKLIIINQQLRILLKVQNISGFLFLLDEHLEVGLSLLWRGQLCWSNTKSCTDPKLKH